MPKLRWFAITVVLPLVYLAASYLATRPPKPVYRAATPTVMTVTDTGGPAALHAPPAVYPAQALRDGVAGSVTLDVAIAADGTVAQAVPVSGPASLRRAAVDTVGHWQFEAHVARTRVSIDFSPLHVTRSLALPVPVRRALAVYRGKRHGRVRVVAMVDPEGRVEFVQPVSGPEELVAAAVESVWKWRFRPMLRDGKPERGTTVIDVEVGP